jgi:transcriptional antiterminator NusG
VDDEQNPNDEELREALEAAAVLDDDAVARVEVATQVAEAAEAAEERAVADGDFAAAERIDQEADEVITELIEGAVVEAETAEDVVEAVPGPPADEAATPDDVATPDEELVVVPEAAPEAPPEPADAGSGDPFRGPGDWYVVHTYAGYENKVKANLESRIHTMQMEDKIFRVYIPMEDVMEIKSGKKQVVQKKVFPGYLLVKMLYDNDSWYVVRNTPGVTGFVSAGTGSKPTPLSKREVEKILVVKKEEQKPQVRLGFEEGDVVRIISGPFADFNGTISEINPDQAKLKVLVNIFDRETPVELSFDQVAKV